MQFAKAIFVLSFAALTIAAPTPSIFSDISSSVSSALSGLAAKGCVIEKCVAAAAPAAVSCASALATEGVNPLADAACLASVGNDVENVPAACQACI